MTMRTTRSKPEAAAPALSAPATGARAQWLAAPEVGHRWGLTLVRTMSMLLGRRPVHGFLWLLAAYYTITVPRVRRASREFMARAGARTHWLGTIEHVYRFAQCTLDRLYFLAGRLHY